MIRFRRFKNTPYAAFASMHKVVSIGVISNYITDLQLRKSHTVVSITLPHNLNYQMLYSNPLPN